MREGLKFSLSGSFLHMETGGSSTMTGGLNICLSGADGHIVGGGVSGPLIAAGPVQIVVGSFLIDPDKNVNASSSIDGSKMPAPWLAGTTLMSPVSLRSCQESSGRMTPSEGSDNHPSFGGRGSSYMFHSQGMPVMPSRLPTDRRDHCMSYVFAQECKIQSMGQHTSLWMMRTVEISGISLSVFLRFCTYYIRVTEGELQNDNEGDTCPNECKLLPNRQRQKQQATRKGSTDYESVQWTHKIQGGRSANITRVLLSIDTFLLGFMLGPEEEALT